MNVTYDKFNTQDVAKIIGVAPQTITAWVRSGFVNATNVSDGTEKARYMFTDDEVTRIQTLIKTYGTRKWMLYAKSKVEIKSTALGDVAIVAPAPADIKKDKPAQPKKFDADKVMDKILELQDLKERLENLEAERNQLVNEIEMLRKEITEVL